MAKRFGAVYTRYADDITFSSYHNIFKREANPLLNDKGCYDNFIAELERLLSEEGLKINPEKTRLQKAGYRQEATGLIVNEKVNVRRRYVKQIRMWLYYWEKYGYEKAEQLFCKDYLNDKGHVKKGKPNLANVLIGKMEFLKMVKGANDSTYKGLKKKFNKFLDVNNAKNETETSSYSDDNFASNASPTSQTQKQIYPDPHNPLYTVKLLNNFSSNDKDLKYTTHSWEFGKFEGYDDFMNKIKKNWKEISEDLKNQNDRLHAKISNFLFNKYLGKKNDKGYHSWGEKHLKFGWSSPELKEFCNTTKNNPLLCPIPEHIRELDKKWGFTKFDDYVKVFKNEIEFREDSNNLKHLILDKRKEILGYDFKIELIDLEGKSFFTDVALFSSTIEKIFLESFKPRPQYPKIKVQLKKFDNFYLLSITQLESIVYRDTSDPRIINPTGGTFKDIIKNMKNLADFSIAFRKSDGKFYRINYLVSDTQTKLIEEQTLYLYYYLI